MAVSPKGKLGPYLHLIMAIGDFAVINAVFFLVCLLNPETTMWHTRLTWLLINVAFVPVAIAMNKVHRERTIHMDRILAMALKAVAFHAVIFLALLFLADIDLEWKVIAEFYVYDFIIFSLWWVLSRLLLKNLRRRGINYTRAIIVGTGEMAIRLYEEMMADEGFGFRFLGFFDAWRPAGFKYRNLFEGDFSELEAFIEQNKVDELYYAHDSEREDALRKAIEVCDKYMVKFHFVPRISRFVSRQFRLGDMGQIPVLVEQASPLESTFNSMVKRGLDILISGTFLIISPLIFIPIAIAIKSSSPGPVFFRQKRTGYRGKAFSCIKFRTMRVNTDADTMQATRDDPRKTRLGDFLRRTSLDELPQFYNVLIGEMSVVGPRPHMLKHTEQYSQVISQYMARHLVKPGITGWAQVRGYRGQTEELWQMQRRVEHDIWYIEHWSLLLDLKIIGRTVLNAFHNEENAF